MDWLRSSLSNADSPTSRPLLATHHRSPTSSSSSASTSPISPTTASKPSISASSLTTVILPSLARHSLRTCIHFIIPSFLQPSAPIAPLLPSCHTHTTSPRPSPRTLSPTAYLDGLRGTAAFLVFIYHFVYAYFPSLEYGFLHAPSDTNILQLPIVRLFMCGASMVSIFFVISGYVLSYKAVSQIRRGDHAALLSTLSSSAFRRAIRLFLPTLTSVLCVAVMIQCGAFTWQVKHARMGKELPGWREQDPPIIAGVWRQLRDAFWAWARMSNPFIWKEYFITYDLHLWTIPVEFRCSILVFISLLALAKARAWVRMGVLGVSAVTCLVYLDRWDVSLFLSGTVLAELTLARAERNKQNSNEVDDEKAAATQRTDRRDLYMFPVFLLGLYIASQPSHEPGTTPGYRTMTAYTPASVSEKGRFWPSVAAVLIVYSLSSSTGRYLQRPFTTAFAQYLGKISYALYLVHGPVCRSLGFYSVVKLWEYTGRETTGGYVAGVLGGGALVVVTVFWVSDMFWRAVDIGCVRLARWVEDICSVRKVEAPR
ncbi:hypothetical protein Dda_1127 [Drechslerella dactyloides]|uniref:Acyltransferase 3 domain-containing protein n=1 Tax=Drechslerella dactyloides TaxID=74499 RepID=A0AAD6J5L4_DREDA|nr:hypothetical protein Dda_1127 [Drechslerella dactyloides]